MDIYNIKLNYYNYSDNNYKLLKYKHKIDQLGGNKIYINIKYIGKDLIGILYNNNNMDYKLEFKKYINDIKSKIINYNKNLEIIFNLYYKNQNDIIVNNINDHIKINNNILKINHLIYYNKNEKIDNNNSINNNFNFNINDDDDLTKSIIELKKKEKNYILLHIDSNKFSNNINNFIDEKLKILNKIKIHNIIKEKNYDYELRISNNYIINNHVNTYHYVNNKYVNGESINIDNYNKNNNLNDLIDFINDHNIIYDQLNFEILDNNNNNTKTLKLNDQMELLLN